MLKSWPENDSELVWEFEGVGNGYGSPVFTPEKIYIMGEVDSLVMLFAFDLNGTLLWKENFGKEWVKNYNGSRSAPTIVGDLIYVTYGLENMEVVGSFRIKKGGGEHFAHPVINNGKLYVRHGNVLQAYNIKAE